MRPAFLYSQDMEGGTDACHTEQDAEYDGEEVVRWGSEFLVVGAARMRGVAPPQGAID